VYVIGEIRGLPTDVGAGTADYFFCFSERGFYRVKGYGADSEKTHAYVFEGTKERLFFTILLITQNNPFMIQTGSALEMCGEKI
jgi:hypothetical protein